MIRSRIVPEPKESSMIGSVPVSWPVGGSSLSTHDHTLVMGVLNVTPDSFSDGGRFVDPDVAVAVGVEMAASGADVIDVGGESTRPGAGPVPVSEEIARVVPVVAGLAGAGLIVSIDTMKAAVAREAIAAGAAIVNDVTAWADPAMAGVCAESGVGVVLMHMQGTPATMQLDPRYDDVVTDVARYLGERAEFAVTSGVEASRIMVDPGIGFGKTRRHNLELLARLREIGGLGYPVLVGTSRKGFIGSILDEAGQPTTAADRDIGTAATIALAIANGAAMVRVHNVLGGVHSARVADAIVRIPQKRE